MWSEKLQSLKVFDCQFTGKAPAACEMACVPLANRLGSQTLMALHVVSCRYFLFLFAKKGYGTERMAAAVREYSEAVTAAGLPYAFEDVCQDMAWAMLQQLIHFMIDTP